MTPLRKAIIAFLRDYGESTATSVAGTANFKLADVLADLNAMRETGEAVRKTNEKGLATWTLA